MTKLIIGALICCLFLHNGVFAQNFGLSQKQDPSTLPVTKGNIPKTERKPKTIARTILKPGLDGEFIISGGWELTEANKLVAKSGSIFDPSFNTSDWYNATVPGTVLTTLVNEGVYPHPYFGLNNMFIPDSLCRMDWWYRTSFTKPESANVNKCWLIFNGINYKADVWLNGVLLGKINGAFTRGEFEITQHLKTENVLAVHIYPPHNPGIPHEESSSAGQGPNGGQLCLDGPTFISSEGWDWVPGIRDRNIGIWQDVILKFTGAVKMIDPQIITDLPLPDTTQASITIKTVLQNTSFRKQTITLNGKIENIKFDYITELEPGEGKLVVLNPSLIPQLNILSPRLWWPNGYGKPDLYKLELTLTNDNKTISDAKTIRFGIRELSYEITADAQNRQNLRIDFNPTLAYKAGKPVFDNVDRRQVIDGVWIPKIRKDVSQSLLTEISANETAPYLVIKVNGQPVYCKGGNWGMDDAMKNCSREYLEPYLKLHRDANFNMVRNWTGESTEEAFYELCDEYGMLVWNDFWLSTEGYNLNVNDNKLFLDNAREVIVRFRNHPSVAIWCPRNEGYAPAAIEEALANLIVKEDGTRYYQGNSRNLNLRPSGPWHYFKDPAEYFRVNSQGFNTEQGTPSIPTAATMRKMMAEEDVWPVSEAWYYHDLHDGQKDYINAINALYGKSDNLETFCKKAQMVNYDSHRAMFESWNSKLWNNTSGLLLWMTHPAWPSTVWQVYSWDYETFGSYFASKKACEPVHIQMNLHDNKIVAVNTSLKTFHEAKVKLEIFDLQGKKIFNKEMLTTISGNRLTECFTPSLAENMPEVYLARVSLTNKNGNVLSVNEYWKANPDKNFKDFNALQTTQVSGKMLKKNNNEVYTFTISNREKVPAVALKLNLRNASTNEIILPAYFSDGYFTLMPGESRTITLELSKAYSVPMKITAEGYNVNESTLFKL